VNVNEDYFFIRNVDQMSEWMISYILLKVQAIFYGINIFIIIKKYKDIYLENYSNTGSLSYKWLFQLTVLLSITFFLPFIKALFKYTENGNVSIWANIILGTLALFVMCWFVLKAMYYPELFRGIDSKLHLIKDVVHKTKVKNKTDLPNHAQIELLRKFMIDQEPYLDPSLTIQALATLINIHVGDLSRLINHHIGQHFFYFVNEYRIQKAKEILRNPEKGDLTILEILYDVGFNSKSSFNTAFRKFTNLTPTEYRNNSL
jgi:AraC-like DNA-binding protein